MLASEKEKTNVALSLIKRHMDKTWGKAGMFCSDGISVAYEWTEFEIEIVYSVVERKIEAVFIDCDGEETVEVANTSLGDFLRYYPKLVKMVEELMPLIKYSKNYSPELGIKYLYDCTDGS